MVRGSEYKTAVPVPKVFRFQEWEWGQMVGGYCGTSLYEVVVRIYVVVYFGYPVLYFSISMHICQLRSRKTLWWTRRMIGEWKRSGIAFSSMNRKG